MVDAGVPERSKGPALRAGGGNPARVQIPPPAPEQDLRNAKHSAEHLLSTTIMGSCSEMPLDLVIIYWSVLS